MSVSSVGSTSTTGSSSTSTNPLALPGLSGYDFSGVVSSLVQAYDVPMTEMQQNQTNVQNTENAWQDVSTRVSSLEATLADLSASTTWNATQVSSSNSSLLSATTGANATPGTYSINVMNTAQAQSVSSALQAVSSSTTATALNAGTFSITTAGVATTITVNKGDSLQTIANSIDSSGAGVNATVIPITTPATTDPTTGIITPATKGYKLSITSNQTGVENAASFTNLTGTVLTDLGITDSSNVLQNINQTAKDAVMTVNGITNVTSPTNTVTSVIPGVTLNINGSDAGASTITLNVSSDSSTAQTKVQAFVDQYNSTMSFIASDLAYDTTTNTGGALFGDQTLEGIQNHLRSLVGGTFNNPTGPFQDLAQIGISTSSSNFGEDATLTFDTSAFATAMSTNSTSVANLFGAPAGGVIPNTGTTDSTDTSSITGSSSTQGLANMMENYLHPMVMDGGTFALQQAGYDSQLSTLKTQIADFATKSAAYQSAQQLKYANLETLLEGLTSQGTSLTASIAALPTYTTTTSS